MEICFTKKEESGHHISCKRDDGTVTWKSSSNFFIIHDLCHYAVESTLGYKDAFYGMLANGIDISAFELPKEDRTFQLTDDAIFVEQLVNLLTVEYNQGRVDNLIEMLNVIVKKDMPLSFQTIINNENLDQIRKSFEALVARWHLVANEESLILNFEV